MRKKPRQEATHILVTSDDDREDLMNAASSGESVEWTVPKPARVGDRFLFFHRSTGLLAEAVLNSEPSKDDELGRYRADAVDVALFRRPIALEVLLEQLVSWGWPTYPRSYVTVPSEVLPTLERLIEKRR